MANKVFVVTGVTSGVGKALARAIAQTGETLIMVARDGDRGSSTLKEIALASQNPNLDLQLCDVSVLSSVRNVAEIIRNRYEKVNVLVNNAGVYRRSRRVTVDGFEEMFAANYLGPFLLTNLLLERLQNAVQADGSARILNITAPSTIPLNFDDLQGEKNFNSWNAFGAAKTAMLLFTFALARTLESTGITVNAIHPGVVRSGLMKEAFRPLRLFSWLIAGSPKKAVEDILPAVLGSEFEKTTGKFLYRGKETEAPAYAYDRDPQQRLWERSEALTALASTKGELPIIDPQF